MEVAVTAQGSPAVRRADICARRCGPHKSAPGNLDIITAADARRSRAYELLLGHGLSRPDAGNLLRRYTLPVDICHELGHGILARYTLAGDAAGALEHRGVVGLFDIIINLDFPRLGFHNLDADIVDLVRNRQHIAGMYIFAYVGVKRHKLLFRKAVCNRYTVYGVSVLDGVCLFRHLGLFKLLFEL